MTAWKERRAGPDAPSALPGGGNATGASTEAKQTPVVPLGPGEWEEGLGVPLSVVCINASKIEKMEREFGWQEEQFDFVLQWMRCVLLKRKPVAADAFEPDVLIAGICRWGLSYLHDQFRPEARADVNTYKSKHTLAPQARNGEAQCHRTRQDSSAPELGFLG